MNSQPKHIVFFYADTGGGHRATAQAAAKAVHQLYGEAYTTEIVNAINYLPYPFNQMEKAYPVFINSLSAAYRAFWHVTNTERYVDLMRRYFGFASKPQAAAMRAKYPADLYVSCQPFLNQFLPGVVEDSQPNQKHPKVIAVVSDLVTVHAGFWSPKVDFYMVPTEEARQRALENHISSDRISITGQPVAPDFYARVQRGHSMREELGLDPRRPTALLMGGGDGMGRLVQTATAISQSNLPLQLVVVCGRNEAARETLSHIESTIPMKVLGFCETVPEWMGASDVLITKAGPGTICEGFIAKLPIILYDAVPGQESGNIDLVVQRGAGAWCPSPQQVVQQLQDWLTNPAQMQTAAQASAALAKPNSALDIAQVVNRFAQEAV